MYRIAYIDWLRVIACFAVILFHISGSCGLTLELSSENYIIMELFHSLVIWCVPIFIMISGALFLNPEKEISIHKLYVHNTFRIFASFVFWSLVYASYNFIGSEDSNRINGWIIQFLGGHFHMWFLWLIIGLYILTPILRKISKDKKLMQYLILISIFFNFVIPFLLDITNIFIPAFQPIVRIIQSHLTNLNLQAIGGYITYFFLGYYLSMIKLNDEKEKLLSWLGIGASIAIVELAYISFQNAFSSRDELFQFSSFLVLIQSTSIFLTCKYYFYDKSSKIISILSKYSFGIYLVHMLIIYLLVSYKITPLVINPIFGIAMMSVLTFLISFGVIALISRMPIIKKWCI